MSSDSRLWVYQSNRALTDAELTTINQLGANFIEDWAAHGAQLDASFDVLFNRFVVISVDEKQAMASGCSIDKSVQFIKELEVKMSLNFFDRMQVAYRNGEQVDSCSLQAFETLAKQSIVDASTIVFNNMVTTKLAFDTEWEIPLAKSWQSRVLAKT